MEKKRERSRSPQDATPKKRFTKGVSSGLHALEIYTGIFKSLFVSWLARSVVIDPSCSLSRSNLCKAFFCHLGLPFDRAEKFLNCQGSIFAGWIGEQTSYSDRMLPFVTIFFRHFFSYFSFFVNQENQGFKLFH